MRGDISLALSLGLPWEVVADWDDRVKVTYWMLLDELADQRKDAERGGG